MGGGQSEAAGSAKGPRSLTSLRILPDALEQMDAANEWWRKNRPAAPDLFEEELDAVFREIVTFPELGRSTPHPIFPTARRLEMLRTRYAVFYDYSRASDEVAVFAVWSSHRGEGP